MSPVEDPIVSMEHAWEQGNDVLNIIKVIKENVSKVIIEHKQGNCKS